MENELVVYEIALLLKELGFDEPCIGNYRKVTVTDFKTGTSFGSVIYLDMMTFTMNFNENNKDTDASALTFSQAFRFFREKFKLHGVIYRHNLKWALQVFNLETSTYSFKHELLETYEDAEIYILQKMIKIIKNK